MPGKSMRQPPGGNSPDYKRLSYNPRKFDLTAITEPKNAAIAENMPPGLQNNKNDAAFYTHFWSLSVLAAFREKDLKSSSVREDRKLESSVGLALAFGA